MIVTLGRKDAMKHSLWAGLLVVLGVGLLLVGYVESENRKPIKIGFVAELTGDIPAVGTSSKNAAELAVNQINATGGVMFKGRKHKVELITKDNKGNVDETKKVTEELIKNDNVVAIVGPNASRYAIPAGEVAEANKTVLMSPWSTNPQTTQNKQYVFRAAYTDPFQGFILAKYTLDQLKITKAAILYDSTADVLKGQSDYYTQAFTQNAGTIVATETFKAGDANVSSQLNAINKAGAGIIFLPAYYNDAASIIKQAHAMGIKTQFLGSDAWASDEFIGLCGSACNGYYLTAHYSAQSDNPQTKAFVEAYKAAHSGTTPDDVAALTDDSFGLIFKAIENATKIDRQEVRNSLAQISNYEGVTGTMKFTGTGDPTKGAVIMQIKDGKFEWYANARP